MGYKILGYAVWHGAKWYLHRRFPQAGRNLALAGGGAFLAAAVGIALTRQRAAGNEAAESIV